MRICLCIHNHQPVGNFQEVMESAYSRCYAPMMEVFRSHGGVSLGLHVSGTLLEWLESNHPEYVEAMGELCRTGQMELLTGGRYEPVLTVFRRNDVSQQIREFSGHLRGISGSTPRGLWLTERVWEPRLASVLAASGVEWAVVDDLHLKRAGAVDGDLFRPCVTEDSGRTLKLLGSDMRMRYMIPFSPVEEVLGQLRAYSDAGVGTVLYGDDGEKFGVWPGTSDLCYGQGWLDEFLGALESEEWLETVLPSEAASMEAAGPFYVPACSYWEMGEWTVGPSDREDYGLAKRLLEESGMGEAAKRLLTGGFWRNFLSRYPESKQLHGRILSSEQMIRASGSEEALHHFWRSQCNCAFWHGVFGGIYLPHLREAVWREIGLAEQMALESTGGYPFIREVDLDADGAPETVVVSPSMSMILQPASGLTVDQLTFFRSDGEPVGVGCVLSRRREDYHSGIPGVSAGDGARTIHEGMVSKEEGLAERVMEDRWRRTAFTDLVMPESAGPEEWGRCADSVRAADRTRRLSDGGPVAGAARFRCTMEEGVPRLEKEMEVDLSDPRITAVSRWEGIQGLRTGIEVCLNLMTGTSPDRFYTVDGGEERLMSSPGEYRAGSLRVVDRWRRVIVTLEVPVECDLWVTPIESVNRSESGFERVHQGTAFLFSRVSGTDGSEALEVTLRMEELPEGEG